MPELPEVETITRQLRNHITGKTIVDVDILMPKNIYADNKKSDSEKFRALTTNTKIISVERKAKVIIINLSNNNSIIFHLKMTGQMLYAVKNEPFADSKIPFAPTGLPAKSTNLYFTFEDGSRLYFNDMRQFGYAKAMSTNEVKNDKFIQKLGPEPFTPEFEFQWFSNFLSTKKLKIKNLLMDQAFISGIGNIYANEALFHAKIHPNTCANLLNLKEKKLLFNAILKVLETGINVGGASDQSYVDIHGEKGSFMDYAKVYKQKYCQTCGEKIIRIAQNGRGTFFCPSCQKEKE
jgi:formamidopyrimidine-DNA glycosylase